MPKIEYTDYRMFTMDGVWPTFPHEIAERWAYICGLRTPSEAPVSTAMGRGQGQDKLHEILAWYLAPVPSVVFDISMLP